MEYRKKDFGSYHLHMIKSDRFKSLMVRVIFRTQAKKELITIRNFLGSMLVLSTKNYKTRRDLVIKLQDLYALDIKTTNERIGAYHHMNVYMTMLNEKYTESGMLDQSLDLLQEIIFHPNVENSSFDQTSFDIVKMNIELNIKSIKEDSNHYAMIRTLEEMARNNEAYGDHGYGYLEDLEKITPKTLYQYYQEMLKNNYIDIYVVGSFDFLEMEKLIHDKFAFYTFKTNPIPAYITSTPAKKVNIIKEEENNKQSKLCIGCKLVNLTSYQIKYPLTLYNIILGGGSDSKLFLEVREKNSLAYTVRSILNKTDNVLLITTGIAKENYKKTVKIVKEQLKAMEEGNISDDEIEKAKRLYITALDDINDSMSKIISSYYMMELLGTDDLEVKRKKITQVTKEEIMDIAKNVKIDTIFFLEGVKSDEED